MHTRHWMLRETAHCSEGCRTKGMANNAIPVFSFCITRYDGCMIPISRKTVIIMVGLPARGKSFFASKLGQYLSWLGYKVRIFNAGRYRREMLGADSARSDFFDPGIQEFREERERIAKICFSDCLDWLSKEGECAVYDATNVTHARRDYLAQECARRGFDHLFIESVCDDPALLSRIISEKMMHSPDYAGMNEKVAHNDFLRRIAHYESIVEPIDREYSFIRMRNFGESAEKYFLHENEFFNEVFLYIKNVSGAKKNVYLSRHGETTFNPENRIGGDPSLTENGKEMARLLAAYFANKNIFIMTSSKKRTKETADFFQQGSAAFSALDEIRSGTCESMTYDEIAKKYPDVDAERKKDKFNYRYPGGESYRDLIWRVRTAVWEIEVQRGDALVIGHRAVNRCIYSYFIPTPTAEIPYIDMPLKAVIRIQPHDHPHCRADMIML